MLFEGCPPLGTVPGVLGKMAGLTLGLAEGEACGNDQGHKADKFEGLYKILTAVE